MTAYPSAKPRRYLALWFPFLPADRSRRAAKRRGDALAEPFVLVHPVKGAMRLAAVSPKAMALGLSPGLTLADARARMPRLLAIDHDPTADAALLASMAEACERWTPLAALDPPDGLILDVTGCGPLFGGEAALGARVVKGFGRGGVETRGTIAGTPDAARALARFGKAAVVAPGGEEAAVRPLPIAALGLAEETRAALALAGLKRIADLADRPSQPLAARFGEDLPRRLERVLGGEDRRITPLRPPPAFAVEQHFAEPIVQAGPIEHALLDLIGRVATQLDDADQGGRAFEARFFRTDGTVRRIVVGTGRPSRDPDAILRLLRERLDALADPLDPGYGFDLIRLCVPLAEPLTALQPRLDGQVVEADEIAALLDRLVARFGAERVLRFVETDTHDPARASHAASAFSPSVLDAGWQAGEPGEPPLRPLQLFDPPQPIETLAGTPDGPPLRFRWRRALHTIARAEGPERIAPEWWRNGQWPTRDYYRVEDLDGSRFWLFRAGLYERETTQPRWYLHGLFA